MVVFSAYADIATLMPDFFMPLLVIFALRCFFRQKISIYAFDVAFADASADIFITPGTLRATRPPDASARRGVQRRSRCHAAARFSCRATRTRAAARRFSPAHYDIDIDSAKSPLSLPRCRYVLLIIAARQPDMLDFAISRYFVSARHALPRARQHGMSALMQYNAVRGNVDFFASPLILQPASC